jgi:hypothetical protein
LGVTPPSDGHARPVAASATPYVIELRTVGRHTYVHGTFHGNITTESLVHYYSELKAKMEEHGYIRLLTDLTGGKTVGSIYEVPGLLDTYARLGLSKRWRRAIVMPPYDTKGHLFETTAVSRGHQVRLFDNLKAAVDWLCR